MPETDTRLRNAPYWNTGMFDEDGLPSCSAVETIDRREPFVNPTLANHELALLARMFRHGTVSYHGAFVRLSSLAGLEGVALGSQILAAAEEEDLYSGQRM